MLETQPTNSHVQREPGVEMVRIPPRQGGHGVIEKLILPVQHHLGGVVGLVAEDVGPLVGQRRRGACEIPPKGHVDILVAIAALDSVRNN